MPSKHEREGWTAQYGLEGSARDVEMRERQLLGKLDAVDPWKNI